MTGNYALAGRELPAGDALASKAHVEGIARDLKRHGVPGTMREVEVMVYLDLTQGRDPYDRLPRDARADAGGSASHAADSTGNSASSTPDNPGNSHPSGSGNATSGSPGSGDAGSGSPGSGSPSDGSPGAGNTDSGSPGRGSRGDGADSATRSDAARDAEDDDWLGQEWDDDDYDESGDDGGRDDGGRDDRSGGRLSRRAPFPARIHLLVTADTLLGWSHRPGEAGRDIIDARTARDLVHAASRHSLTRWDVTVVGANGTAIAHGRARGQRPWPGRQTGRHGRGRHGRGRHGRGRHGRQSRPRSG